MSGKTSIEWTRGADGAQGRSWNPVTGCEKVSPGCKNCYAEAVANRFWAKQYPGRRGFTDVRRHVERLDEPLSWRKPTRIFVNSMSDLFHQAVSNYFIAAVFGIAAAAPRHTFQILTKRAERLPLWFRWVTKAAADHGYARLAYCIRAAAEVGVWNGAPYVTEEIRQRILEDEWPLPNVHLGVSAENQVAADARIADLLVTPAAVRFVSVEPLLGAVNLAQADECALVRCVETGESVERGIDWVIVGGESGPGARSCDIAWVRSIVEQCRQASVPCFVKQLGSRPVIDNREHPSDAHWIGMRAQPYGDGEMARVKLNGRKGADPDEWPPDLRVREFPVVEGAGRGGF